MVKIRENPIKMYDLGWVFHPYFWVDTHYAGNQWLREGPGKPNILEPPTNSWFGVTVTANAPARLGLLPQIGIRIFIFQSHPFSHLRIAISFREGIVTFKQNDNK